MSENEPIQIPLKMMIGPECGSQILAVLEEEGRRREREVIEARKAAGEFFEAARKIERFILENEGECVGMELYLEVTKPLQDRGQREQQALIEKELARKRWMP